MAGHGHEGGGHGRPSRKREPLTEAQRTLLKELGLPVPEEEHHDTHGGHGHAEKHEHGAHADAHSTHEANHGHTHDDHGHKNHTKHDDHDGHGDGHGHEHDDHGHHGEPYDPNRRDDFDKILAQREAFDRMDSHSDPAMWYLDKSPKEAGELIKGAKEVFDQKQKFNQLRQFLEGSASALKGIKSDLKKDRSKLEKTIAGRAEKKRTPEKIAADAAKDAEAEEMFRIREAAIEATQTLNSFLGDIITGKKDATKQETRDEAEKLISQAKHIIDTKLESFQKDVKHDKDAHKGDIKVLSENAHLILSAKFQFEKELKFFPQAWFQTAHRLAETEKKILETRAHKLTFENPTDEDARAGAREKPVSPEEDDFLKKVKEMESDLVKHGKKAKEEKDEEYSKKLASPLFTIDIDGERIKQALRTAGRVTLDAAKKGIGATLDAGAAVVDAFENPVGEPVPNHRVYDRIVAEFLRSPTPEAFRMSMLREPPTGRLTREQFTENEESFAIAQYIKKKIAEHVIDYNRGLIETLSPDDVVGLVQRQTSEQFRRFLETLPTQTQYAEGITLTDKERENLKEMPSEKAEKFVRDRVVEDIERTQADYARASYDRSIAERVKKKIEDFYAEAGFRQEEVAKRLNVDAMSQELAARGITDHDEIREHALQAAVHLNLQATVAADTLKQKLRRVGRMFSGEGRERNKRREYIVSQFGEHFPRLVNMFAVGARGRREHYNDIRTEILLKAPHGEFSHLSQEEFVRGYGGFGGDEAVAQYFHENGVEVDDFVDQLPSRFDLDTQTYIVREIAQVPEPIRGTVEDTLARFLAARDAGSQARLVRVTLTYRAQLPDGIAEYILKIAKDFLPTDPEPGSGGLAPSGGHDSGGDTEAAGPVEVGADHMLPAARVLAEASVAEPAPTVNNIASEGAQREEHREMKTAAFDAVKEMWPGVFDGVDANDIHEIKIRLNRYPGPWAPIAEKREHDPAFLKILSKHNVTFADVRPYLLTEKEYELFDAVAEHLSYLDVLKDNEKERAIVANLRNPSGLRGARALLEIKDRPEFESRIAAIRADYQKAMDALGIAGTRYGKSKTWSVWDVAKQHHYHTHPESADKRHPYHIGDPLTDSQVARDISNRHLGWEVYGWIRYKNFDVANALPRLNKTHPSFEKILDIVLQQPNSSINEGELSSYDYAQLGALIRENLGLPLFDVDTEKPKLVSHTPARGDAYAGGGGGGAPREKKVKDEIPLGTFMKPESAPPAPEAEAEAAADTKSPQPETEPEIPNKTFIDGVLRVYFDSEGDPRETNSILFSDNAPVELTAEKVRADATLMNYVTEQIGDPELIDVFLSILPSQREYDARRTPIHDEDKAPDRSTEDEMGPPPMTVEENESTSLNPVSTMEPGAADKFTQEIRLGDILETTTSEPPKPPKPPRPEAPPTPPEAIIPDEADVIEETEEDESSAPQLETASAPPKPPEKPKKATPLEREAAERPEMYRARLRRLVTDAATNRIDTSKMNEVLREAIFAPGVDSAEANETVRYFIRLALEQGNDELADDLCSWGSNRDEIFANEELILASLR